jgi:DNA polymerase-1
VEHRKLAKLHGTYILGLSKMTDPYGRVHTTFNQDVARTGRLSSKEPNLQNIPKADNDKWKIRGAFIASPGNKLIVGDYEQLEMRLLACASLDEGMIDVICRGWDIHMGNASLIFGIPYEEIKEAKRIHKEVEAKQLDESYLTERIMECVRRRDESKTTGFAVIYGLGIKAMARRLGITEAKAADIMKRFNKAMPAAEAFKHEAIEETEKTGYAFTIMGRRRNVPQILSDRRDERAQGERIAVNTPIQGSAADVVKMAQINLDKAGLDVRYNCHSLLQVHDEIAHECPAEVAEEAMAEIKEWMEYPFSQDLAVPLGVDIAIGNSWLEAKA